MRTEFPDTKGQWMSPLGFPLLEIRTIAPDLAVNVGSRPTGFRFEGDLQHEGEKVAYRSTSERYFQGDAAAAAYEATSSVTGFIPTPPATASDLEKQSYQDTIARQVAEKAIYDRVMTSGKYVTAGTTPSTSAPPIAAPAVIVQPDVPAAVPTLAPVVETHVHVTDAPIVEVTPQVVEAVKRAALQVPSYHVSKPFWRSLLEMLEHAAVTEGKTALVSLVEKS